ncbi:hypothetical protein ACZ90_48930 [Streptomyces albus subsp. albus]|nr:hypothetical protein ACZ90_48930 [Streptomyces albus subsp. albus]
MFRRLSGESETPESAHVTSGAVEEGSRMTMRVYRTTRDGAITEDRGTVHIVAGENIDPCGPRMLFPPCLCRRCRGRNAPEGDLS